MSPYASDFLPASLQAEMQDTSLSNTLGESLHTIWINTGNYKYHMRSKYAGKVKSLETFPWEPKIYILDKWLHPILCQI